MMEKNNDWLADCLEDVLKESARPKSEGEWSQILCPHVITESNSPCCMGKLCSHFTEATPPKKYEDGFPVATSVELSRMTPELRKEHEESMRWMGGLFLCGLSKKADE